MADITQETISEAHRLVGFLKGLQEGLRPDYWNAAVVTDDMIERLRGALAEAHGKADYVAGALSRHAEGPRA